MTFAVDDPRLDDAVAIAGGFCMIAMGLGRPESPSLADLVTPESLERWSQEFAVFGVEVQEKGYGVGMPSLPRSDPGAAVRWAEVHLLYDVDRAVELAPGQPYPARALYLRWSDGDGHWRVHALMGRDAPLAEVEGYGERRMPPEDLLMGRGTSN